jgi:predicted nucleic-acid-binding protein
MPKDYITLDTNVYISFYTKRDQGQFEKAKSIISDLSLGLINVFLPSIVVGEIFYILIKLYDFPKILSCESIQSLINFPNLVTENKEVLLLAIEKYSTKNIDFVDCYLLAIDELSEYKLQTFDKKLKNQIGK